MSEKDANSRQVEALQRAVQSFKLHSSLHRIMRISGYTLVSIGLASLVLQWLLGILDYSLNVALMMLGSGAVLIYVGSYMGYTGCQMSAVEQSEGANLPGAMELYSQALLRDSRSHFFSDKTSDIAELGLRGILRAPAAYCDNASLGDVGPLLLQIVAKTQRIELCCEILAWIAERQPAGSHYVVSRLERKHRIRRNAMMHSLVVDCLKRLEEGHSSLQPFELVRPAEVPPSRELVRPLLPTACSCSGDLVRPTFYPRTDCDIELPCEPKPENRY